LWGATICGACSSTPAFPAFWISLRAWLSACDSSRKRRDEPLLAGAEPWRPRRQGGTLPYLVIFAAGLPALYQAAIGRQWPRQAHFRSCPSSYLLPGLPRRRLHFPRLLL